MPPRQRKYTAAAPKPEQYGFRCRVRSEDGTYACGVGPDGQPKLISGFSSDDEAQAAVARHLYQVHPTSEQKAAASRRSPAPQQRQPWRRRPVVNGPSI